ncbi:hypothetical protein EUGRSUZ_B01757 [Eucalyptus grandis]|uniref:Uncharacterized protein n=2 Tax=Eucalyptus grandis TaxID=71139 RepID=A0ACC3LSG5_EUCGR|nr:hypothetical protein EUGRSUZ_B01757 [Eucalyptus grandis]
MSPRLLLCVPAVLLLPLRELLRADIRWARRPTRRPTTLLSEPTFFFTEKRKCQDKKKIINFKRERERLMKTLDPRCIPFRAGFYRMLLCYTCPCFFVRCRFIAVDFAYKND